MMIFILKQSTVRRLTLQSIRELREIRISSVIGPNVTIKIHELTLLRDIFTRITVSHRINVIIQTVHSHIRHQKVYRHTKCYSICQIPIQLYAHFLIVENNF